MTLTDRHLDCLVQLPHLLRKAFAEDESPNNGGIGPWADAEFAATSARPTFQNRTGSWTRAEKFPA